MIEKVIQRGAEAVLVKRGDIVLKRRVKKGYRLKELDEKIRKLRTRSEARLLERAAKIILVPVVESVNEKTGEIKMEFIDGLKLSENLDGMRNWKEVCFEIGREIGKLHDADIIHGDLTTSNMIWSDRKFVRLLDELRKLKLPESKYAVFGSGPISVRGLRESDDLDIIVNKDLWEILKKKYGEEIHDIEGREVRVVKVGEIEFYNSWLPWIKNVDNLIDTSELIEGLPFVRLDCVAEWKKKYGREKDKKDIKLIEDYLSGKFRSELDCASGSGGKESRGARLYIIDFGLGFGNGRVEDKAVDLHLIKQALEAKHFENFEKYWKEILEGYKECEEFEKVLRQFEKVERRGRYKQNY